MCLIVNKNNSAKIADKDIICYKTVFFEDYIPNIVISKSIGFVYRFKKTYNNGISNPNELPYHVKEGNKYLNRRLFHSYKNIKGVKSVDSNEFIVKCTIPKGTYYFEGITAKDNVPSYASSSIIIEKIISKN